MTLLALLIGLVVERLATQLFHLRRLRWLDRLIDLGFQQIARFANWPALIPVILLALLLILPVFLALFSLQGALYGVANLVLAIVVLFFSIDRNGCFKGSTEENSESRRSSLCAGEQQAVRCNILVRAVWSLRPVGRMGLSRDRPHSASRRVQPFP
jgi:membrane protein required for beta-lactamase induction